MNSYSYITHLGASRKNFRGIVSACEGLRRSARRLENASGGLYKRTTRRFRVGGWGGIPTRRVWNDGKAIHGPRQAILARVWGRYGRHMYRASPASGGCNFAAPVFNRQAKM